MKYLVLFECFLGGRLCTFFFFLFSSGVLMLSLQLSTNKPMRISNDHKNIDQYERYTNGDLKGFIKLPDEQFFSEIEKPFIVNKVEGIFLHGHYENERIPLVGVIIELRGPGSKQRIYYSISDHTGTFYIKEIPNGKYRFKTSFYAFQPIIGSIIVSKTSVSNQIELRLLIDN